jgi:hypothetical protein
MEIIMINFISLSLYGTNKRYWNPIPYLFLSYERTYMRVIPNLHIKLHIHHLSTEIPLYKMLEILSEKWGKLQIQVINEDVINARGMLWRMIPLWDKNVKYFFCRDIDTVPVTEEIKSVKYFVNKQTFMVHGMRSHPFHTLQLMGGLCGFDAENIRNKTKLFPTYIEFLNYAKKNIPRCRENWKWGGDQDLLHEYFLKLFSKSPRLILDCKIPNKIGKVPDLKFPAIRVQNCPGIKLHECDNTLLLRNDRLIKFAGEPVIVSGSVLKETLKIRSPLADLLNKIFTDHPDIRRYYM